MNLSRYDLKCDSEGTNFYFTSIGPRGTIPKLVRFQNLWDDNLYNLAFGDLSQASDSPDDMVISNNGDMDQILATVAYTIWEFTKRNPEAIVVAKGSTKTRTRLYQIKIIAFLEEIESDFQIKGLINENWIKFEIGTNFEAFSIVRK
jgi:hypothetical protein